MNEQDDVASIGGAVMGSAVAHFLGDNDDFRGRVVVLEKDRTFANAASSRSTSGFRQQFSTAVNIALSRYSAEFIKDANILLAVNGDSPGIDVVENGYLYLGRSDMVDAFEANNALQREMGVKVALLSPTELTLRFPWLNVEDLAIGSLGQEGEGWLDGYMLMNAFRRRAQHAGIQFRYSEVVAVRPGRAEGYELDLSDGTSLAARKIVNVAGTSAPRIAAMSQVSLPVQAAKQNVYAFDSPFRAERMPYVFTPDGLFCRPEGTGFIAGTGIQPKDLDVDPDDLEPDYDRFEEEVWPRLAHRVAAFEQARFRSAWAGHYDMSLFDHNPFIGEVDGLADYYLASGFSGHGLMQSPGVGRALSELIVYGCYRTLDLSPFDPGRIARGVKVVEDAII